MRVKTYKGPDIKTVLARVKSELGPDAVILGQKEIREEGVKVCEVTAALEDVYAAPESPKAAPRDGRAAPPPPTDALGPEGLAPGMGKWHQEWTKIREQLTALLKPRMDLSRLTPRQRLALEYLEREGVGDEAIIDLYRGLANKPEVSILKPLEAMIPIKAWGFSRWPQTVHCTAGPSGVGKTTALARMAMLLKRKKPGARIRLVSADSGKIGGKLVLKRLAELIDVEHREIPEGLPASPALFEGADRVLVDLPTPKNGRTLPELLDALGLDRPSTAVHLTLSPSYSRSQFRRFFRVFGVEKPGGVIWTKLDEAADFGALVDFAQATGLPAVALAFGDKMGDGFAPATDTAVFKLLFKHETPPAAKGRDTECAA